MKRKFYIIAHNPNSVIDSLQALKDGANSLEPDVHCIDNKFYVGEKSSGTKLRLEDYLAA